MQDPPKPGPEFGAVVMTGASVDVGRPPRAVKGRPPAPLRDDMNRR